jgi:hypothetical protein
MAFTAFQARKLNPEEVNPFSNVLSKALQGYGQGMKAAYMPQQIEADIFAKKIGPLATLATTPAFLQNPQFQAALGQIISKHLGYGQGAGQGAGQGDEMPTYAGQAKKDVQDAESIAKDLSKAGKVRGYVSSAGGGAVNYLGDVGKKIIDLLPGKKTKEFVNPALAEKQHQFDTYLQGLKNRALQTQTLNQSQAEDVFSEHKDENEIQRLQRIKRAVPSLFQQDEGMGDTQGQGGMDEGTAMDVEDQNNNDNRDLSFAADLSEQIKAKTGHDISPDLIFNYMQKTPGKINIPLLLKAAGVR